LSETFHRQHVPAVVKVAVGVVVVADLEVVERVDIGILGAAEQPDVAAGPVLVDLRVLVSSTVWSP